MLSFEEFSSKIMNGESRNRPGVGCGYILIKEKGKEVFYGEWTYEGIDTNNELTALDWDNVEMQDQKHVVNAYAAYVSSVDYFA